ncbi:MAG: hypothetical protein WAN36_15365, partial [Calditrichia bacterium]
QKDSGNFFPEYDFVFRLQQSGLARLAHTSGSQVLGLAYYKEKIGMVRKVMQQSMAADFREDVGLTLADGGEVEVNLEKIIGKDEYRRLLNQLLKK